MRKFAEIIESTTVAPPTNCLWIKGNDALYFTNGKWVSLFKKEDFINITDRFNKHSISLIEAIQTVPTHQRIDGLVITFEDINGDWRIYQFRGDAVDFFDENKWTDLYDYTNYIVKSITPDEEDLTVSKPDKNGNAIVSLKDKVYDESNFSGKGYKILRKNIQTIDGVRKNILTQNMINKPNTVYEIRYDFDLNNEDIHIPSNCVLKFVGGQLRNGSIVGDNTRISATNKSIFYNVIVKSGCIGELQYEMYANTENSYLGEFKVLRQYITDCYNNNLQPYFGLRNKLTVEYDGIPIEVPEGKVLDFNNITIECINNTTDNFFINIRTSSFIAITDNTVINNLKAGLELNKELNNVDFIEKNKTYLINIKDNNPWTAREGYGISVFRKDITLIHNRLVYNLPIATYNNEYSSPSYSYREVLNAKTIIRNLTFIRSENSTKKTLFLTGRGVNNLEISNININTVNKNNLSGDAVILIDNSANVTIKNCVLYGLYDYEGYAYGFALNNIYNFVFQNCRTYNNNWGVFGNNNLNKVTVNDCTINRFDIHCYGKDLVFNRCSFMFKYNQYSSIYGKIIYNNCCFTSFIPCFIEPSYNCYTPFDLILNNCVFNGIYPVYHEDCDDKINTRVELQDKCLPNIDINNCYINDISSYSINNLGNFVLIESKPLEIKRKHINNIAINGLTKLITKPLNLKITKSKIVTQEDLSIQLSNVILANSEEYSKLAPKYWYDNNFNFDNINPEKGNIVKITVDNSNLCFDNFQCTQNIQISCINSNLFNFRNLSVNSDINKFFYKNCTIHLTNTDESSSNRNFFPEGAVFEDCVFNNSYNDNRVPSSNLHFIRCTKTISNKPLLINALVMDKEELNNFSAVNPKLNVDLSVRDLDPSASNLVDLGTMKVNGIKAVNKVNNRKLYYLDGGEVYTHFLNYGTFADRPTDAPAGFEYFCADRQTSEGGSPGIVIYNRGGNIWVDALGRVVS